MKAGKKIEPAEGDDNPEGQFGTMHETLVRLGHSGAIVGVVTSSAMAGTDGGALFLKRRFATNQSPGCPVGSLKGYQRRQN